MFGISDKDLLDPTKIKILNGIAGSGKSTSTVTELRRLGSNFCLASFSNALKFAASDKFGCPTDTICGLEFVNSPYPRSAEKPVIEFDTVVNDEILLDGAECIEWMINNVGKVNIIALTDSRQMLNAENGDSALKAFNKLLSQPYVISVEIKDTKRARDDETKELYDVLYNTKSEKLFNVNEVQKIFKCDIVELDSVDFNENDAYLCHSNVVEHELYKKYNIPDRRDINLIPKNHISRKKTVDVNKYPICDQLTAVDKKVLSYLQAANIATPTRFQGKEVPVGNNCYFVVQEDDIFTGREIYTVGTRCQSMHSLHIAIARVKVYKDPDKIRGRAVVTAKRLNIPDMDVKYQNLSHTAMTKIIGQYGAEGESYYCDIITSGNRVIYSTMSNAQLQKIATFDEDGNISLNKKTINHAVSIRSMVKKDTTMHFDFMPRVYELLDMEVTPPRINNPRCKKSDFGKLCDIYSAFPTVLNYADMPKAGYLYETYDKDLLNFYIYGGDKVTKGSVITEELANKLGDSKYVFSTPKQSGCAIGHYAYEQCKLSKEKKSKVSKNFLWGILESGYYTRVNLVTDGEFGIKYIKRPENNLELVACALWSKLCLVMLEAIESIGVTEYMVVTDGLYYNGDKDPTLPEWCDYRIELKDWSDDEDTGEKYKNVVYKTYDELKTDKDRKKDYAKERWKNMTPEERAKKAEKKRASRANMTPEQKAKEAERKRIARQKARMEK